MLPVQDGFKPSVGDAGVLIDFQGEQEVSLLMGTSVLMVLAEGDLFPPHLLKILATVLQCVPRVGEGG